MKQSMRKVLFTVSLSAFSSMVYADADIAVQPAGTATEATANVDICVVVPEILIFGVGDIGDTVAKVIWTYAPGTTPVGNNQTYSGALPPFTAPAPFDDPALVSSITGGGASATGVGTDTAELPVYLFSNNGSDVTITVSDMSGGSIGGGTTDALDPAINGAGTIPITDFVSGDGGAILQPTTLTTGSSADTPETDGIVNLTDFWTYQYSPVATPVAGTYDGRITYIASQP